MERSTGGFAPLPAPGWQSRRGGVRVYFCCCPLTLLLAPPLLLVRLLQYGCLRLMGRPVGGWWERADTNATRNKEAGS
jgi:hypothetical protein